jgi:hypothetical protein
MAMFVGSKLVLGNDEPVVMNNELARDGTVGSDQHCHEISNLVGDQSDQNLLHNDALVEEVDEMVEVVCNQNDEEALDDNPVCVVVLDYNQDDAAALDDSPVCVVVLDYNQDDAAALADSPVCVVVLDYNQDDAVALDDNLVDVAVPVFLVVLDDNQDDAAALDDSQVCEVVQVDDHVLHRHE